MHPADRLVLPFGDDALLVELGAATGVREARRSQALALAIAALRAERPGLGEPVPGAASVLVPFDPLAVDADALALLLRALAGSLPEDPGPAASARETSIAVRFGGADGPDLAAVARETGLVEAAVVDLLCAGPLEVLFLGFAPGFGYLGELPAQLALPRLAVPRTRVPAGSLGIAGRLAGIYPHASAGGWRLLGRTDTVLFDPESATPSLLRPGDRVRLVPA